MVQPPTHLSPEAQAYLLDPVPPYPMIQYGDPEVMAAFRAEVHPEFEAMNEQLPGPWVSRDEVVSGVPVVRFASSESALENDSVIVHLHGGGFVIGSPRTNASVVVPVAQHTGLPVVSVDYRLAPEHKCPAAVEDAYAVCEKLGESHRLVALYGESAGGGIAVSTAIALRDSEGPMPERLGLMSPNVDLTYSGDSFQTLRHVDNDFPDPDLPPLFAAAYADAGIADPQASPLFADLAALPPTLIQVGGREILLSDSLRLDQALRRAGVRSTLDVWDGLWHGWQLWPDIPEAQSALAEMSVHLMEET